ncbi:carbohydrate ABC transporter permease [Paenibacillus sp. MAH-36]|uniref:Carbohydrate ABC transporter permease n=1 Tax=Paenibacillus violae TaxID=3077234 RepID=A0ABU3RDM0_9BACL|nr:carbohydrate ABC transporter permease [Paenibacillus sp. PFR10]MDU0202171.1 carbohydrate ABC transporter permease [Paenibacillus sp. PFR10]
MEEIIKSSAVIKRRTKSYHANAMSTVSYSILLTVLGLASLLCVLPLILVISVSFSDESHILRDGYQFIPEVFSVDAYRFLVDDLDKITTGYGISILVTVVGTFLSLLVTSLFAYPVSRPDFPYRNQLSFIVFFTMLFGGGLVPWYLLYTQAGLKNTLFALIIPHLVVPFNVIIMRIFFTNTIPHALIESAKIDGAGELRIYGKIILPLSLPVLATVGLFQMLSYWNDWYTSLIFINNPQLVSLQYLLYKVISDLNYINSGAASIQAVNAIQKTLPSETAKMAMAVIGIGPIILVYPFLQKYLVKGLTVGSVKG